VLPIFLRPHGVPFSLFLSSGLKGSEVIGFIPLVGYMDAIIASLSAASSFEAPKTPGLGIVFYYMLAAIALYISSSADGPCVIAPTGPAFYGSYPVA
jgi:hypothetical protein